jgi:ATP-dependent DNA helicase PIF1
MPAKKSNIGRTTIKTRQKTAIRLRETCEERDERQQVERIRAANSRARETSVERDERQEVDRIRAANSRARETSEERDARQEVDRSRHIQSRTTIDLNKAAFNYDKYYDYSNHRDVQIGTMTYVCFHCRAPNVIEATIINNKYKGEDVLIPRIPMIPSDLPFTFKRLQFPVRLAFAMTINKAQGQSLQVAGLNLENPCFSHGQLYVACSRVGTPRSLYVYTPNQKTKNIVHPLALR